MTFIKSVHCPIAVVVDSVSTILILFSLWFPLHPITVIVDAVTWIISARIPRGVLVVAVFTAVRSVTIPVSD